MPQPNHQRRYTGQQDDEHLCRFAKHLPASVSLQNLTHKSLFIGCELGHALYDLLQPLDCVIIGAAACSALRALIRGIIFWRWSGVAGIQLLAPCRCCYSLGRPRNEDESMLAVVSPTTGLENSTNSQWLKGLPVAQQISLSPISAWRFCLRRPR